MRVGTNLTQAGLSPPRPFWPLLHNLGQIPTHTPYISYLLFLHFLLICLGFSFYFFLNLLPHNLGQIPTHTPYISYLCTLPAFPNYFSWIFFLLFLVHICCHMALDKYRHTHPSIYSYSDFHIFDRLFLGFQIYFWSSSSKIPNEVFFLFALYFFLCFEFIISYSPFVLWYRYETGGHWGLWRHRGGEVV